ncbi:MAG: tetratricopeptide repeat protein [Rhodobacteraceae bacterium]|nr:tetratricopeptide repeat protein [Paracoccaceae bacterium]
MQLSLPQALREAHAAQTRGDLDRTADVVRAILKAEPRVPEAHHLMGIVLHRKGNLEGAIAALRQAVALAPRNGLYLANLCEMQRQAGRLADAVASGRRAVAMASDLSSAHGNLGIALYEQGDHDAAEACQQRAIEIEPQAARPLNNLGSIAVKRRDPATAEAFYRRAMSADPGYLEAACNLATVLVDGERPQEALALLIPRAALGKQTADWHRAIARAFLLLDDLDKAEIGFGAAMALKPGVAASHLGLSEVLHKKNRSDLALAEARRALEIEPESAAAMYQIGLCEADLGHTEAAFDQYGRAIAADATLVAPRIARGHLFMETGNIAAARADFEAARAAKPDYIGGLLSVLKLEKVRPGDADFAALEQHAAEVDTMLPEKAVALLYALGKCYDDLGRTDDAFAAFARGAALKRKTFSYDADAHDAQIDRLIAATDAATLARLRGAALSDARPIFVIGMPRSGTTMTESILASHPAVVGAGELPFLPRLFPMGRSADAQAVAEILAEPAAGVARRFTDYLGLCADIVGDTPRFTDKMPCNFQYAGLIHALLPQAKIVHVLRDPVDTCLSNFTRLFDRSQFQSYDLVELGRYYRAYRRLMDHWASVLPPDAIVQVRYEDLVADTESGARALLAGCGLGWTDACLRFQDVQRRVRTASVTQVREPVYRTSVQKWRKYEAHLAPLLDTLGPLAAG